MSAAFELYRRAQSFGLQMEADGDTLLVWPKSKCPPELGEEIKSHKAELLAMLSHPPCPGWRAVPPEDVPLNPLLPQPQPRDARRVVDFIARQTDGADAL